MGEGYDLAYYLPTSYKSIPDSKYIQFLWEAYETNYSQEKYQFAHLSLHMLFMSFVYFNVWQIKKNLNQDFEKALYLKSRIEKDFLEATSPFVFWRESERSIFNFFKLIGCPKSQIGQYKKLVDLRNDIAHSNGNIYFENEESHLEKVSELLRCVEEIQGYSKPIIESIYEEFLLESWDEETRQYISSEEQIQEVLIHQYFFSEADIQVCIEFDIDSLSGEEHFDEIKDFHTLFLSLYSDEYKESLCQICKEVHDRSHPISFNGLNKVLVDKREDQSDLVADSIEITDCSYCGATHFKCALCKTENAIWNHDLDEEKQCEGCGATYLIDTSEDRNHNGENYQYKLMND